MAEEKEDPRAARRNANYSHARSKSARGEEAGPKGASAEPQRENDKPLDANDVLGRHGSEREAMRKEHESQRRDEHNSERDEHRSMNARHETQHEGAADHPAKVALHRSQEHEKDRLRRDHAKRQGDMAARQQEDRHTLNTKHEAEMMGAGAAAAAVPSAAEAA